MSVLSGKRFEYMLDAIAPHIRRLIAVPLPTHRALTPAELATAASERGVAASEAATLAEALDMAFQHIDSVVALGSLYLVGAILRHAGLEAEDLSVLQSS